MTDKKIRTRSLQQRTVDTRQKILEAAIPEFASSGLIGASTRSIADSANVRHSLIRYHFESKEGLWRAVITFLIEKYAKRFEDRLYGLRGVDPVAKLRIMQEEFIRFSAQNPDFHRIMGHAAGASSPELDWLIANFVKPPFEEMADLIRAAQAEGKYVAGDPYHLQYVWIGAVTRIFMLAGEAETILRVSPFDAAFVEEHARLCLSIFFRD